MTMPERCDHDNCGFESRLEYCAGEATNPEGVSWLTTQLLDDLLCNTQDVRSESFWVSADGAGVVTTRSFSYLRGDFGSYVWPLHSIHLSIQHTLDKKLRADKYHVVLGWRVHQQGVTDDPFATTYDIEEYPRGDTQSFMEAPDIFTGARESRLMTDYDLRQLYHELDMFARMQAAEHNDNIWARENAAQAG